MSARWARAGFVLNLVALGTVGCRDRPQIGAVGAGVQFPRSPLRLDRFAARGALDSLFTITSSSNDLRFLAPYLLAVGSKGPFLVEPDQQILALDSMGNVRWRFGTKGQGPTEFANIRGISSLTDGRLLVLDGGNAKLVTLNEGQFEKAVRLDRISYAERLISIPSGFVLLTDGVGVPPLSLIDTGGHVRGGVRVPWLGFDSLNFLLRQGVVASSGDSDWVFAMSQGGGWFAFQDTLPRHFVGQYVQRIDLPQMIQTKSSQSITLQLPHRPSAAKGAFIAGRNVIIALPFPPETGEGTWLDQYSLVDGKYIGSYQLPFTASQIAGRGDRFYSLSSDSVVTLRAFRLVPKGR